MTAKSQTISLSHHLTLPADAVTQTWGFFGRKGSGKTYAAGVLAEKLLSHKATANRLKTTRLRCTMMTNLTRRRKVEHRKHPCTGCPFSPAVTPGETGGSDPLIYVGQANGPFWLPCHNDPHYEGKQSDPKTVGQCAGAAIFRANIGVAERMPAALVKLPANDQLAFTNEAALVAHHKQISLEEAARQIMEAGGPYGLLRRELDKNQAQFYGADETTDAMAELASTMRRGQALCDYLNADLELHGAASLTSLQAFRLDLDSVVELLHCAEVSARRPIPSAMADVMHKTLCALLLLRQVFTRTGLRYQLDRGKFYTALTEAGWDMFEQMRRERLEEINAKPLDRVELEAKYGLVWDTDELCCDFDVHSYLSPCVMVTRKSDGQLGSLMFQHSPRFYFEFMPHPAEEDEEEEVENGDAA